MEKNWLLLVGLSLFLAASAGGALLAFDLEGKKIDLNQADALLLEDLPGIGPALAKRIVAYRKENGPFTRIEDLMDVKGIGEKKFLKLRDRITVSAPPPPKGKGEPPPAPKRP